MNSILRELYHGDYNASDKLSRREYRGSEEELKMMELERELREVMPEELRCKLDDLYSSHVCLSEREVEQAFIEGFSLAMRMILAAVSGAKE